MLSVVCYVAAVLAGASVIVAEALSARLDVRADIRVGRLSTFSSPHLPSRSTTAASIIFYYFHNFFVFFLLHVCACMPFFFSTSLFFFSPLSSLSRWSPSTEAQPICFSSWGAFPSPTDPLTRAHPHVTTHTRTHKSIGTRETAQSRYLFFVYFVDNSIKKKERNTCTFPSLFFLQCILTVTHACVLSSLPLCVHTHKPNLHRINLLPFATQRSSSFLFIFPPS